MGEEIVLLPIDSVKPNPWNPNYMSEDERRRLREGMASSGPPLTPPIFVRKMDDHYEIIDGEQRWLVARELGWTHMPAIIRDVSDAEAKRLTLSLNYLKGKVNYAKVARWIRDKRDFEMFMAFEETFGSAARRILEGLMNLPDECLNMIEEAVQRGVELTLSDLEPVVKAQKPYEALRTMIVGKKCSRDTTLRVASRGLEKAAAELEEKERLDAMWREGKLEAAEEERRKIEEKKAERERGEEAAEERIEEEEVKEAGRLVEAAGPTATEAEVEEEVEEAGAEEVKEAQFPPERAKELLEAPPEEALKKVRRIEALAEAGAYYQCICGAIHALAYSKGSLQAYLVKPKERGYLYTRLEKEASKWLFACPKCGLKFKVDFVDGAAMPLWEENLNETVQG
ncbi:MAG: ParB/RepB/Spo0J family partition protein [Candidatus Hadarchaeales archaeon]